MTLRFLEDFTIFSAGKSSRKLIGYLPVKNIFVEKNRNILGQIYMQFSLVDQRRETAYFVQASASSSLAGT
ncbi:MAG: hypothetical protein DMG39_13325 [Acidobacteria bacterium]|nr:MAG: hypothetical protein DMG39_13325 [Acidobacteriota bacterium]